MAPAQPSDELFRRHSRALWALLYARSGDAELARDAVQEAFMRFEGCQEAVAEPRGWLFRVALNWQRDQQRRRRPNAGMAAAEGVSDRGGDPLALAVAKETRGQVRAALARLPIADREALTLRYGLQWNSARIAETLGSTPAAVDMRLSRARAKLATAFAEMGIDHEAL